MERMAALRIIPFISSQSQGSRPERLCDDLEGRESEREGRIVSVESAKLGHDARTSVVLADSINDDV